MTNLREAAQMALDAYESKMQQIGGCSDGGCVVVKPKGMHTNGGCKCWKNERSMQRLAMAANSLTKALRAALAQPEPEKKHALICPKCKADRLKVDCQGDRMQCGLMGTAYTAPPQREWQGLTDEEMSHGLQMASNTNQVAGVRWFEAKLKEKNT